MRCIVMLSTLATPVPAHPEGELDHEHAVQHAGALGPCAPGFSPWIWFAWGIARLASGGPCLVRASHGAALTRGSCEGILPTMRERPSRRLPILPWLPSRFRQPRTGFERPGCGRPDGKARPSRSRHSELDRRTTTHTSWAAGRGTRDLDRTHR